MCTPLITNGNLKAFWSAKSIEIIYYATFKELMDFMASQEAKVIKVNQEMSMQLL